MTGLVCSGCDYLFLPRPWLEANVPALAKPDGKRLTALYVRGDVMVEGQTLRLPYWHKLVRVVDVES